MKTAGLSIYALGDISFKGRYEDQATSSLFENVTNSFETADIVVANLESPLITQTAGSTPGKCTLRSSTEWAAILKKSGIDVVTLANNHMMDYGDQGLFSTIAALDKAGIVHVGAGKDRQAACLPLFIEKNKKKVAFLGRSCVEVSSLCYAGEEQAGVAPLDEGELIDAIEQCRHQADVVVVMLHWGMEHYHYPTPQQRLLAQRIVLAGADILLGHHPHVLQGEERIGKAVVSYSSGNFLFDEFPWSIVDENGVEHNYKSTLSDKNRQGMILKVDVADDSRVSTRQIFTKITDDAVVAVDTSLDRQMQYNKLCSRLQSPIYDSFWKLYSIKREWDLRLAHQLSLRNIARKFYKIRPRHFKELAVKIRRSAKVSSGKSTNPYEG